MNENLQTGLIAVAGAIWTLSVIIIGPSTARVGAAVAAFGWFSDRMAHVHGGKS